MKDKEKQIEICEKCKIKENCSHRILIHMEKCKVNDCDYFQNISTDEEKQIEEITNVICESCNGRMGFCFYTKQPCEQVIEDATALYDAGYRKIGDSVVLSKEEYNETLEQFRQEIITLSQELVNSRKETAEKFESELKAFIKVWKMSEDDAMSIAFYRALFEKIGELANQFGVEIKE